MPGEEPIKDEVKERIKAEVKKAEILNFALGRGSKWYERAAVISVLILNSFLPLRLGLKLCYWTTCLLAKNPRHRVAVDAVKRIKDQESGSRGGGNHA
jgi:hypothetical protein